MAEEKIVTDFLGRPIGRLIKDGDKTTVTDFLGKPLGSADSTGTRDFLGKPISRDNVPDILFGK